MPGLAKVWVILIVFLGLLVGSLVYLTNRPSGSNFETKSSETNQQTGGDSKLSADQKQFQSYWKKGCQGTGPIQLTALPMKPTDFGIFIPLGLLAGAHVTPIDHLYFSPADRNSQRDAYPVYAMGDGYLIEIQRRSINVDTGAARKEEFRLTFQHTCTFYTYFDLVTSLTPDVLAAFPELSSRDSANGHMAVKAGQQIGKIGGQTLDSAVYNLEVTLPGYIHPELYDGEAWKIHTDEFTKYFPANLQAVINSRNVRVAEPRDGKIDYDVDGKLIGNWFKEGTKGYVDEAMPDRSYYWEGHLALVPDVYDPNFIRVSIGNWSGKAQQFAVKGNSPDPALIGVGELVKYELVQHSYLDANGKNWDNFSYTPSVKGKPMSQVQGVALFQLLENRQLKVEFFPGKTAAQVSAFTDQAWNYFR